MTPGHNPYTRDKIQSTQGRFSLLMQCNFLKADARLHPVTSDVSGNLGMRRHTANGRG